MQQFRNILVGVDLSSSDRLAATQLGGATAVAVERAIWLAQGCGAQLTFLAVIDISPQTEELLASEGREIRSVLEEAAGEAVAALVGKAVAAGVNASGSFVFGTSWLQIIRKVLRDRHDLVIVGTRGLSAPSRLLFGSTSFKLLRKCPCPVWVTRPDPVPEDLNILVASDLGEVAEDALHLAIHLASVVEETKIHLVHALDLTIERRMMLVGTSGTEFEKLRNERIAQAEQQLHEQLSGTDYRTLKHGVQVHVLEGQADIVIQGAIGDYGIDLLTMGTVGRSGVQGLLVGNTAERILSRVDCSILALKPTDFQCPVSPT